MLKKYGKNLLFIVLLLFLFFCGFSLSHAATYYVDNSGDDANDGLSEGAPWQTIAKVNAATFAAGGFILFQHGDLWREELAPHNSGSTGNHITYGAYDAQEGNMPRIYASDLLTTWEVHSGSIWKAAHTGAVVPIWFIAGDGTVTWGDPQVSIVACVNEYDWFYDSNFVYVYSPADPDTRYASIEGGYRTRSIKKNNKNYITIDGIECAFSKEAGIELSNAGYVEWTVQNCDIHHVGVINSSSAHGIVSRDSDSIFQNNRIWHAGTHGIYIVGPGAGATVSNVIIRDNEIWDCPHTGIDIMATVSTSVLDNIQVYRNILYTTSAYPATVYMTGIQTAGQSGGIVSNVNIYNNLIYHGYGSGILIADDTRDTIVANNTVYGDNGSFDGITVAEEASTITLKNNIVMEMGLNNYNVEDVTSLTAVDYNLSYHTTPEGDHQFKIGATKYSVSDFAAFKLATGFETHGVWADPKFISVTEDYRLNAGSPAQDAGIPITGIHDQASHTDLIGIKCPIRVNPSMGAYEYVRKVIKGKVMPGISQ